MLLMIDNYDSFTHNLARYFSELDQAIKIVRNDQISIAEIQQLNPQAIIISPGPRTPNEAGISLNILHHFAETTPILGVCLGHQAIAQYFGTTIVQAKQVMHGKTSSIVHQKTGLFKGLKSPLTVARYHSLLIDPKTIPSSLEITAWTQASTKQLIEIMAISHKSLPIYGVQFHPEAILTEQGHELLRNFLILSGIER